VKFPLNETDIEKKWENLQNILKSAAYESLGKIKRLNGRKYLQIWDDQIKQKHPFSPEKRPGLGQIKPE
jgi:hypothetical protein